jgi:hypothetical protein
MAALEWYLCRGVIEELYARSDGRQDRSVVQRGCMGPKDGTREYDAEPGIKSERSTETPISGFEADGFRTALTATAARSIVSSDP